MICQDISSFLLSIHHILVSQSITISSTKIFTKFNTRTAIFASSSIRSSSTPSISPFYIFHGKLRYIICPITNPSQSCLPNYHNQEYHRFSPFSIPKIQIIASPSIIPSSMPSISPYHLFNDVLRNIIPHIINPSHCRLPIYHNQSYHFFHKFQYQKRNNYISVMYTIISI